MKNRTNKIHMVGVGGVGMSGIAEMLQRKGYQVSGSDINFSATIERLRKLGIKIQLKHDAKMAEEADVMVYSSAIDEENVEIVTARKNRIPLISRAEMLSELMRFSKGIAVAGTHGKTTTTSLLALTLDEANLDPTYIIGGILNSTSSNAQLGKGEYIVAEADESDASFLQLQPVLAVVTNIDLDHMPTYKDDPQQLQNTFIEFIQHLPFYGTCVACSDDEGVKQILPHVTRRIVSYGFNEDADFRVSNFSQKETVSTFTLTKRGEQSADWQLNMPGKHNVLNSVVSIIIADELEIDPAITAKVLKKFPGVGRRFDVYNNQKLAGHSFKWIDDYAHHPREIIATWEAVSDAWSDHNKVIIFQPHRYTRTRDLFDDFITALSSCQARLIILTEVYAASEPHMNGSDSESLIKALRLRGINNVILTHNQNELYEVLPNVIEDDDIVLSMGAGSISNWMKQLLLTETIETLS